MRENLPKEMNFVHEAANASRAASDFENIRTSLYIPQVLRAKPRILVMEYIEGGRVDDLKYLADHNIDRNKVALELARVFARMVHLNGYFHAVSIVCAPLNKIANICAGPTRRKLAHSSIA
jgi:aarF domain-containing kinase